MTRVGWQLLWRSAHVLARALGPQAARRTARLAGAVEGLTDDGVHRVALRISPRLARENPEVVKVSTGWAAPSVSVRRQGLRLELDLRDNLQTVLYYAGRYEPAVRRFLVSELRNGYVVLDVGANLGLHALTAAKRLRQLGGGRVIALEPADDCLVKLQTAADRNNLQVKVVAAALDRLDVVKLDIEGAEVSALTGAAHSLMRLRPRAVLVEDKRSELSGQLHDVLDELGYRPTGEMLDHNALFRPA